MKKKNTVSISQLSDSVKRASGCNFPALRETAGKFSTGKSAPLDRIARL